MELYIHNTCSEGRPRAPSTHIRTERHRSQTVNRVHAGIGKTRNEKSNIQTTGLTEL